MSYETLTGHDDWKLQSPADDGRDYERCMGCGKLFPDADLEAIKGHFDKGLYCGDCAEVIRARREAVEALYGLLRGEAMELDFLLDERPLMTAAELLDNLSPEINRRKIALAKLAAIEETLFARGRADTAAGTTRKDV